MNRVEFNIEPVPKGRPRHVAFGGHTRTLTPKKTRVFEKYVKRSASVQWTDEPLSGPVFVQVFFTIPRPKSVSEKKRPYPIVGSDLDNYIKSVLDACNGVLWDDDKQIVSIKAEKSYGKDGSIVLYFDNK